MYGKIFESIYDGSLYGEFEAIVVFKAMIVLADESGSLDMSPQSIAGRTSYPIEVIKKGLSVLQKPDPDSRQPAHEGRRIVPLENGRSFGWHIVNYEYYRNLANREAKREADRIRIAEKRSQNNDVAMCRIVSQEVADVAHTDTDTNTYLSTAKAVEGKTPLGVNPCPYQTIVDLYHEKLPMCPRVAKLTDNRKSHVRARWKTDLETLAKWRNYFDYVAESPFLTGRTDGNHGRPPFISDFDWLIKPANVVKVAEGKYHRSADV